MKGDKNKIKNKELIFKKVFSEMSPKLYRFAWSYLMNVELAEDIVQDTFMRFWVTLDSLPEDTGINSYLYTAVKNSCLNYYKHLQVKDTHKNKLTEALVFIGSLQYEECDELYDKVQALIQKLPEQQRKVLELKIFKEMSYREIAKELKLSEVTVHTHIKRAYKTIREALPVFYLFLSILGKI